MSIIFYTRETLKKYTHWRWGEEKLGDTVSLVDTWDALAENPGKYVLLGIPEDIGVRANYGIAGASKTWEAFLHAFCNIQNNEKTQINSLVILGELQCHEEMQDAQALDPDDPFYPTKIGSLVKAIDDKVSDTIQKIVSFNKIPIVIGGGHNNAYGLIKGTALAFGNSIHCINLDAHSDFRALEHRHSGNGFSYAMEEGHLDHYYILGLHRNYTSQSVFNEIEKVKSRVKFSLFEDTFLSNKSDIKTSFDKAKKHLSGKPFGVELDLDAIEGMGSSAISPIGVNVREARQYVQYFGKNKECVYIHLCEGNPSRETHPNQVAKTLSYLVSDIISL